MGYSWACPWVKSVDRKAADLDCGGTIRCSLSLWTTPQSIFLCNGFLNACLYPPKRKSYVLSTSVLDFIAFDFWINEKAATLHHERQEDSLPLWFAMLCSGFEIQNPCQPCRLADISILYLCAYLIFNLPISPLVFQNTIAAIWLSRFCTNFLVFSMDRDFIHLF